MNVLITRPDGQETSVMHTLAEYGFHCHHLPLLSISARDTEAEDKELVMNLDRFTGVIVVSPNAARHGLDLIEHYWPQFPVDQYWLTNGYGTAKILEHAGLEVAFPETGTRTEDLLELPELDQIIDQQWLIIKGEGGRELLREELEDRGARVSVLQVYQRSAPDISPQQASKALAESDAIVITSAEALENLHKLIDVTAFADRYCIVSSSRLAQLAGQKGWKKIVTARGASDQYITQALVSLNHSSTDGTEE